MSDPAAPIYVIGSINTDLVVRTPTLPRPGQTVMGRDFVITAGGKGANQAVAAARLGGAVSLVARLGMDAFGDQALARLQADAVDCAQVTRDPTAPSGVALISVDDAGNNQIVVAPGANDTLDVPTLDAALTRIPADAVILIQLEIPFDTVTHAIAELAGAGRRVVLDPAPARSLPEALLADVFLVTPNETEAEALTGVRIRDEGTARAAATALLEMGAHNVGITLGANGVLLATPSGIERIAAPSVVAVDTTAAGDCFNGAVAVALAHKRSLADSVRWACHVASMAVTRRGAQDAMPYAREAPGWG
ncbi:MAG: ribokinase [Acidobacteria bacterium]|nr:ribokinase [Acidobacteriota bacterium]